MTSLKSDEHLNAAKLIYAAGINTEVLWRYKGAEEPLRRMSKSNDNLYSYRLDWDEEDDGIFGDYSLFVGAAHGIDVPFISNSFDMEQIPWYIKNILFPESSAEGRDALSSLMMRYWGNIAKYGDPNVFVSQKMGEIYR